MRLGDVWRYASREDAVRVGRCVTFGIAASAIGCAHAAASTPAEKSEGGAGFAVVELFTSEGCSSCPPADDVLRDVAKEASERGRRVYPLAFHVDYWNDLGWPDPYSSTSATARQHAYARALGERGVYTPEMVVNGRDAFVGSNRTHARDSIDAALSKGNGSSVELRAKTVGERIVVDFAFAPAPRSGMVLELALVQLEAVTRVAAGENAGRTLRHANVVRAFRSIPLDGAPSGHATLASLPGSAKGALIGFVQDPESMAVRAATRVDL